MKVAVLVMSFITALGFAETAYAQFGQFGQAEWGVPHAPHSHGLLIDDTRSSEINRPATDQPRFAIVHVRNETILLDTATGETWRLVFADSKEQPFRWELVPRKTGTGASRPQGRKKRTEQDRAAPSNEKEFDPFRRGADDSQKRSNPKSEEH